MKQKVWIVGANGAIGFELVKIYLKNGFKVVASSRDIENSKDFLNLKSEYKTNLKLLNIDVLDEKFPQLNKYLKKILILKAKVSKKLILSIVLFSKIPKELNPTTIIKNIANQGITIFDFSFFVWKFVLINHKDKRIKNGTKKITLIIFSIIAFVDTISPKALLAPTTWATSWSVAPI